MLFLTYWFVLFACVAFPAYWLVRAPGLRRLILLAACVVFHTQFAGPAGVIPIIVLAVATYFAGRSRNRAACYAVILLCASSLVFYKYIKFVCLDLLGSVWPAAGGSAFGALGPLAPPMPPLAISFFVFEFVHYLFEVAHGAPPLTAVGDFGLFTLFWPSIVAGPVKRYDQFIPALHRGARTVCSRDVAVGILLVTLGVMKKIAADHLSAVLAFHVPQFAALSRLERWGLVLAVGFRILWDFSGYSDMAIGFARMMGVRLPTNFNWPYLARSITDFWRRWHMSLSSWIRDYIYIPLGGSRHGAVRKVANGLLAFGICGLWHGAAWNFLFWGVYHGAGLALGSGYRALLGPPGRLVHRWLAFDRLSSWLLTMVFVQVGWLFFFYPLPDAFHMLALLFRKY